jgi:hypothetical protein
MDSILSNTVSRRLGTKVEASIAICMKREGFTYRAFPAEALSRSAGSDDHFSLAERRSIGFGVSALLAPPPAHSPGSTEPAFQSSLQRCRLQTQKTYQPTSEAILRVGKAYLTERRKAEGLPAFSKFRLEYSSCMAQAGFPGVKTSQDAFDLAMKPFNAELPLEQVREIEIPIAVADFRCVTKNDKYRRAAFEEAQTKVGTRYSDDITLIETKTR